MRDVILCCDCEGTEAELTRLWQAIEKANVAANFFFTGETARRLPTLVREIASRHQADSHTFNHPNLRRLSKEEQRREILGGRDAVEDVIGRRTRGFRAPYHHLNRQTVEILNEENFVFDASTLYFRYDLGGVQQLKPTWFREWMPLYDALHLPPSVPFGLFRTFTRVLPLSILPAHPQYAGRDERLATGFHDFLAEARDAGAIFWPIDKWLAERRGVQLPAWISPLGPAVPAAG